MIFAEQVGSSRFKLVSLAGLAPLQICGAWVSVDGH